MKDILKNHFKTSFYALAAASLISCSSLSAIAQESLLTNSGNGRVVLENKVETPAAQSSENKQAEEERISRVKMHNQLKRQLRAMQSGFLDSEAYFPEERNFFDRHRYEAVIALFVLAEVFLGLRAYRAYLNRPRFQREIY